MKNILCLLINVVILLFFLENEALAINGGAYNSAPGKRMDISSANNWYIYEFPITDDPVVGSVITYIYYQYAINREKINGTLIVELCNKKTTKCVDISDSQSGMISYFYGDDAKSEFFMKYKILIHGGNVFIASDGVSQITVNWSTN
ncbi:flagellar protein FlhE [Kosakonia sp. S42]|uniref:flagellar protein FlhE n=1 Tax=Kosakonia sp. S42 TaxID=2767458 RepID=UPI001909889E|nr:flagellar protein FlhE [Kosakonia sp. S42]MBK0019511.1 flagellar protein FlhE [Kosakonia sp. S42]